jgi:hypothetical protein
MTHTEDSFRQALGIPPGARRVIVFGETSHWDPNWLFTAEEYFRMRIGKILDRAIEALEADPRRVFGIESVFFLKLYWQRRREQRQRVRELVSAGRLRMLGCGVAQGYLFARPMPVEALLAWIGTDRHEDSEACKAVA